MTTVDEERMIDAGRWGAGEGWHLLEDLGAPGSAATVDHVLVTPAGVFVVDFQVGDQGEDTADGAGAPWASRAACRRELTRLRAAMSLVADALAGAALGSVEVAGVVAVAGASLPAVSQLRARRIDVVPLAGIVRLLSAKRRRYPPDVVDRIADALDDRLRSRPASTSVGVDRPAALAS